MTFSLALISRLCSSIDNDYPDNYDYFRFGPEPQSLARPADCSWLDEYASGFEKLYCKLSDERSKALLVQLIAYRILGHRKVALPLSTPDYWESIRAVERLTDPNDSIQLRFLSWRLCRTRLHELGLPVDLYTTPKGAYTQFILKQYKYNQASVRIGLRPGYIALDAGGCWGDTALAFALEVGQTGQVFTFEFLPENLTVMKANKGLNPALAARIRVTQSALLDAPQSGTAYKEQGPGTYILRDSPSDHADGNVTATSIDEFARESHIGHFDYIKMDIEGSELRALHGAFQTIRRDYP